MQVLEFPFLEIFISENFHSTESTMYHRGNMYNFPNFYEFGWFEVFQKKVLTSSIFCNPWRIQQMLKIWSMLTVGRSKPKTECTFFLKEKKAIQKEYKLSFCNWNNATLILPCSKSIWEFITGRTLKRHKVTASKFAKACALHTLCGILFTPV